MKPASQSQRIIVALDEPWQKCQTWIARLKSKVWGFKIGSILFAERGPKVLEDVRDAGHRVFLDLKYHDIPNTVEGAVRNAFSHGVNFLTVHASGGRAMLEAASKHQTPEQKILAVTVLTSLEQRDMEDLGVRRELKDQVTALGQLACHAGIAGLVCSPHEVKELRALIRSATLVCPGVRLSKVNDDQKRTASIAEAFSAGADYVVLGRALTGSSNWEQTWQEIISSLGETS